MGKFWMNVKESWFIWGAFVVFFILTGSMAAFSADWNRSFVLDFSQGGDTRTEMLDKLDDQADETFTLLNVLKASFAGTTAPTSPSQGQVWYDTLNSTLKVWEASTWISAYSYSSDEFTWLGEIASNAAVSTTQLNAVSASLDNLEASTISAPYATITDLDVVSATVGSATINTFTSVDSTITNLTATDAVIGTLTVTNFTGITFEGVTLAYANTSADSFTSNGTIVLDWLTEINDSSDYHVAGTPERITIPTGISYAIISAQVCVDPAETTGYRTINIVSSSNIVGGESIVVGTGRESTYAPLVLQASSPAIAVTAGDYFEIRILETDSDEITYYNAFTIPGGFYAPCNWFQMQVIE